eukprot:tig00021493_g21904.t1
MVLGRSHAAGSSPRGWVVASPTSVPPNTRARPCATSCGKTSWTGCGMHVESVKASVPPEQRCSCGATNWEGRSCVVSAEEAQPAARR